jgi:hypothetical protein
VTPSAIKIAFAVLSVYERNGWIHPSILQYFCDLPFKPGYAFRMIPVHNFHPAAAGRNVFCKAMKDNEADWLCMVDNDMALPDNLLDTLKDAPADADIIVPTFYMWDQGSLKLTLCWGMENVESGYARLTPGFHELTKCGTGVIFIKPHVLRAMEYPYFKYVYNGDCGLEGTEDIQFCLQARAKGFKIYGSTAVKVGHYHSVDIGTMFDWAEKTYKHLDTENASEQVAKITEREGRNGGHKPKVETEKQGTPERVSVQMAAGE